ncbi:MAG: rRNA pseudouridine synthase [Oscillospiraceae bacterium]|nr:rRNA pseudouridine synthase [Oscillospiraceae bacterium]
MERLDKLLSSTGRWSRREAKELVRQGRVTVNGAQILSAEEKIDPGATVAVDGETLSLTAFAYVMLHKPAGVVSATEDGRDKTVLELLPPEYRKRGLAPVGRLDKDTEGLLLLTDDGALSHRLTSPRSHVEKVYYARVEGVLTREDAAAFAAGMTLSDGLRCLPAGLELLSPDECLVTLREGKFHQIKRMLAQRGKPVRYLKRLSMGPLQLDVSLLPGQYRLLTPAEVEMLRG